MSEPLKAQEQKQKAEATQQQAPPPVAPAVNVTQTKPQSPAPSNTQGPARNKPSLVPRLVRIWRKRRRRESPKWTDKAIVFLTIGIVILAWTQHRDMLDSGTQTDKIIKADERIATAMEGSVNQAQNSFSAANKQAELTQRAWLHILVETQAHANGKPFVVGEPIDIRVTTKNTGRTPAIGVKSVIARDVADKNKSEGFPYPPFIYHPNQYVFDGNITPDQAEYGDFTKPFTAADLERITSQEVRMYVHGRVEYADVFGQQHWLTFCTFLLPTGAWANCPVHNDMDQNSN